MTRNRSVAERDTALQKLPQEQLRPMELVAAEAWHQLDAFTQGTPASDDVTMMAVTFTGMATEN